MYRHACPYIAEVVEKIMIQRVNHIYVKYMILLMLIKNTYKRTNTLVLGMFMPTRLYHHFLRLYMIKIYSYTIQTADYL